MLKQNKSLIALICLALVVITSVVSPTFSKYVLTDSGSILESTVVEPKPIYTISFIDQNQPIDVYYQYDNGDIETWHKEKKVYDNTTAIPIDKNRLTLVNHPSGKVLQGWENAGGTEVTEISKGHTTDIVLYPIWAGEYWVRFMDGLGNGQDNVLLAYLFVEGNKPEELVDSEVTAALELAQQRYDDLYGEGAYTITGWDKDYNGDIYNVQNDIVITAVGAPAGYEGTLTFRPIDDNSDGIPDRYETSGVDNTGTVIVKIPEYYNGKEVTNLGGNTFADFADVHVITIPKNVTSIGDYVFAENWTWGGDPGETQTIYYEGSYQDWLDNMNCTKYAFNGLSENTRIFFLNGGDKVDPSQGYLQVKKTDVDDGWFSTDYVGELVYYDKTNITTTTRDKYYTTCDCGDAHDYTDESGLLDGYRPDYIYWGSADGTTPITISSS